MGFSRVLTEGKSPRSESLFPTWISTRCAAVNVVSDTLVRRVADATVAACPPFIVRPRTKFCRR